jgi:hypothetical protein
MSSQASVRSIDTLKDLRVALALYGEDTLGAIGAVEAEVRRTLRWLQEERPVYWQEQIKRRREQVTMARAEVFRKNLQKRPDYNPPMSEQKENLRKAEASLQDAEKRLAAVKKWQPLFKQAVLEYHASVQRIKDLAAGDIPRAANLLSRIIDSLEAYLRVAPPLGLETPPTSGVGGGGSTTMAIPADRIDAAAVEALDEAEAAARQEAEGRLKAEAEARSAAADPAACDRETDDALDPLPQPDDEAVDA